MPREVDESLIEATIRRIAEAQAAREEQEDEPSAPAAPQALSAELPVQPISDVRPGEPRQVARGLLRSVPSVAMPRSDTLAPEVRSPGDEQEQMPSAGDTLSAVVARLDELARQVDAVSRQVDVLASAVDAMRASAVAPPELPVQTSEAPTPIVPRSNAPVDLAAIDRRPIPSPLPPLEVEPRRGLDLLPQMYRVTVEDKRRGVDLVPLHRALLSMAGVRDMALLSYSSGAAIVSLETTGELNPETLAAAVSRAMARTARAEVHSDNAFVVKVGED